MTCLSIFYKPYFLFQIQNPILLWVAIGVAFAIEIYVFCCNGARSSPANMITLAVFTFC